MPVLVLAPVLVRGGDRCELAVHVVKTGCWRWCCCRVPVPVLVLVLGAGAGGVACVCEGVYFRIFFPDSEAIRAGYCLALGE